MSKSQQAELVVKRFDYIYGLGYSTTPTNPYSSAYVIQAATDSTNRFITKCFARAFYNRWNINLNEERFAVKGLTMFRLTPKFDTELKEKEAGKWYLFLQVFDQGNTPSYEGDGLFITSLEIRCKLVSSIGDSVITDRKIIVNLFSEFAPQDQEQLGILPIYPPDFIRGFDSIATWAFASGPTNQYSLKLRPACVFKVIDTKYTPLKELLFTSSDDSIHQLTAPEFSFHLSEVSNEKKGINRNIGVNTITGAITIFTGISSNKTRSRNYIADFPFSEGDDIYHCRIGFDENESAQRDREKVSANAPSSYSLQKGKYYNETRTDYQKTGRSIDQNYLNLLILNSDTIASFKIKYVEDDPKRYKNQKMWDGSDSTTITDLTEDVISKKTGTNVVLSGILEGQLFSMKSSSKNLIKKFYLGELLVAIIEGGERPFKGYTYQPLTAFQLKIFTILASLPYENFHETYWH